MYDQNFRNQAIKECVNGQSMSKTAKKYGVSTTAIRDWLAEYKERMANLGSISMPNGGKENTNNKDLTAVSDVKLKSVNINIEGHDVTISKKDIVKLMEIFYQFDK